ncbi:polyamine-transporting ATPase 13A3-like isoform X2 [Rhodnius prolixus]|uniref:polyamine-transporting ATPase 13A3-like isoform X2 n=1 Tax=Rhodnius prolixus TaxID=13249 RepID=UPI003D18F031
MKNGIEARLSDEKNKGYINKGEEDEMEIYGYREYLPIKITTWTAIILTAGLLRLVFHWWPKLMLYATHRPCNLATATKLLVIDTYEKRFKSSFIKNILFISLPLESNLKIHSSKNGSQLYSDLTKSQVKINFADGSIRELAEFRVVKIKKLRYLWIEEKETFIKLAGIDNGTVNEDFYKYSDGYSELQQQLKQVVYGLNEINVPISTIPALVLLDLLTPFFVFQIYSLAVWLNENYYYYAIAIIIMTIFGTASSVIQTHQNQKRLQKTVHSAGTITVKRNEKYEEISTGCLVPGDVIVIPPRGCIMHCDAVLLNGKCIVNESMLTGESVPVTKNALPKNGNIYNVKEDSRHTLFCGTNIIQTRYYGNEKVHAVVTKTGFLTSKGSLVRSILYPPPVDFQFEQDSFKFIWFLAAIGVIGFAYTVFSKTQRGLELSEVALDALDLFTTIVPPALPAAMTVGRLYALKRLKKHKIFCINSRIINVSGSLNCVCFDKTGTLTEDGLDMWGVIPISNKSFDRACHNPALLKHEDLLYGMATCHSLTLIDNKISGDPLDVKIFESINWKFEEPTIDDVTKYDVLAPSIVYPKLDIEHIEFGILHQFQFSSKLQRMSVICRKLGSQDAIVYCKGAPEAIASLSVPESVPSDLANQLRKYTQLGFRVLAMAVKILENFSFHKIDKLTREEVEKDLCLVGFIVLENRLKTETIPTIKTLKDAEIKVVMITGDNLQTAVSVAKECSIIDPNDVTIEVNLINERDKPPELIYTVVHRRENLPNIRNFEDYLLTSCECKLTTNGKTWEYLREHLPDLVQKLITNGVVFARMTSEQKQQLVVDIQKQGFYVAMCGDGANDCGALKAAHVGISLSEAEASVASPFTSQEQNIACVPKIIKEGRAALITSFGIFKFMILYSLTEFFSTVFLYTIDSNLTDFEFLIIDVGFVVNFAFLFGHVKAYKGPLVSQTPPSTMLHIIPLTSMFLHLLCIVVMQVVAFYLVRQFSWYVPFKYVNRDDYTSYENYAVYCVSQFQYIAMVIIFSEGPPYRERIYKNKALFISIIIMTLISIYISIYPANWVIDLLSLKYPQSFDFPILVVVLGFVHILCCLFLEECVVNYLMLKKFKCGYKNRKLNDAKYCVGRDNEAFSLS